MKHDLVDAFWLKIFPITLGGGKRLFAEGITNGPPFLRVFFEEPALSLSKGRESEMPAPSGFDLVSATKSNSTRSMATHSCKKCKDEAPSVERCTQRSLKVGHRPLLATQGGDFDFWGAAGHF